MSAGAAVLGSQYPGVGALMPDGAWALFDASDRACDCCSVCNGTTYPANYSEDFAALDPEWTIVNPSPSLQPMTLSYPAGVRFASEVDVFTPGSFVSHGASLTRLISKQTLTVEEVRIGMTFTTRFAGSGASFINFTASTNIPTGLSIVSIQGLHQPPTNYLRFTNNLDPNFPRFDVLNGFVNGVVVEHRWIRVNATTYTMQAYVNGALVKQWANFPMNGPMLDIAFGCDCPSGVRCVHGYNAIGSGYSEADDLFSEIISS